MMPFVGLILRVGFNFAPIGWAPCDGRLLSISEYSTLYALIGTTYGGDGQVTFGLPDLRGRIAVGQGPGSILGQQEGAEEITLTASQIGAHSHPLLATTNVATLTVPATTSALASVGATQVKVYSSAAPTTALAGGSIGPSGQNQPHENRQPYTAVNYIIALEGIFPSQG
jgi:microcystin-dependent protein